MMSNIYGNEAWGQVSASFAPHNKRPRSCLSLLAKFALIESLQLIYMFDFTICIAIARRMIPKTFLNVLIACADNFLDIQSTDFKTPKMMTALIRIPIKML